MTQTRTIVWLCAWLPLIAVVSTAPAGAADAANGERLARRWCSTCHLVSADQAKAAVDAPPFSAIAQMPGFSAEKIAFLLLDPHPKMPNMSLTRNEAADLAAYIASSRK